MSETRFVYIWVVYTLTLVFKSYTVAQNSSVDDLDDALRAAAHEVHTLRQVPTRTRTPNPSLDPNPTEGRNIINH